MRTDALTDTLKEKDPQFFDVVYHLSEALFEQLMISHRMMEYMYGGASGRYLHSHLLDEACNRAEVVLWKLLDLAMRGALGEDPGHLRA